MAIEPRAEHFVHSADIGIRGIGRNRSEAFEQAALALSKVIIDDPAALKHERSVHIECEAPNDALLLVDWLNALIYRMAVDHLVFGQFQVAIDGKLLHGEAWGESIDRFRHAPAVEPKGATYTGLQVAQQGDGSWIAQCVVDV